MPLHSLTPLPGGPLLGLWHLTETPTALWPLLADAAAYAPLLPARADGLRQAQWLAGRVLVQQLLAASAAPPATLRNDEAGRPFLLGPASPPTVSISHSGEWAAALLAPSGMAVGIDIEVVREKAQRIARKFLNDHELTAAEHSSLADSTPGPELLERYSLLWSAKETLYKLAGRRGIIFRDNLLLDLPPGTWPMPGVLPARLQLNGQISRHQICYLRPAAGYVLTYCY